MYIQKSDNHRILKGEKIEPHITHTASISREKNAKTSTYMYEQEGAPEVSNNLSHTGNILSVYVAQKRGGH